MKRIVDGVTYNTETSSWLGRRRTVGADPSEKLVETLYQTRGGAFFIVERRETVEWNKSEQEAELRVRRTFVPVSAERAQSWMLEGEVHVFRNPFGDPPEAIAEAKPGATIYIRVPATLKRAADAAASEQKLSGNVWAMRCIERCLEHTVELENGMVASLIRQLMGGDKNLAIGFKNAKVFWTEFFEKNSQQSVAEIAKELGSKQHQFEAIFDDSQFAKEMMPLTCLSYLSDAQGRFRTKKLTKKIVEAFKKSFVSIEIKNVYLEAAIRVYPVDQ